MANQARGCIGAIIQDTTLTLWRRMWGGISVCNLWRGRRRGTSVPRVIASANWIWRITFSHFACDVAVTRLSCRAPGYGVTAAAAAAAGGDRAAHAVRRIKIDKLNISPACRWNLYLAIEERARKENSRALFTRRSLDPTFHIRRRRGLR